MNTLTVRDFVSIIQKEGNPKSVVDNHNELEKEVDRLSNEDRKHLIIQMTYVLDALMSRR